MQNIENLSNVQNIENLISSLDSEVVAYVMILLHSSPLPYYAFPFRISALGAFDFPESHMAWANNCDEIFSDIYASAVRKTKDDIRTVARGFRGQLRAYRLLQHIEDLVGRNNMLRLILSTVCVLVATTRAIIDVVYRWIFLP